MRVGKGEEEGEMERERREWERERRREWERKRRRVWERERRW